MGYLNYSVEDFLADESFQQYCSGTGEAAVDHWAAVLREEPEVIPRFEEAVQWFRMLNGEQGNVGEQTARLLKRIGAAGEEPALTGAKERRFYKSWWAAAAVLLLSATAGFFLLRQGSKTEWAKNTEPLRKVRTDITPGGDKAVLTLANGQKINLDGAANGDLSQQGGTKVIKTGGQLSYKAAGNATQALYNTVSTPNGGQYQLLLADGTKVWLNAASSLRFPTAFAGAERRVELTGEGYFEVAHDAAKPFHVAVNDVDVQVLGTHFNVNGYGNEEAIKTTLLQGRVMVKKEGKSVFLAPGQQAQTASGTDDAIRVKSGVDVEAAVAWKNGLFQLDGADVKTIGRQIERWYDVEINYKGNLQSAHLSGDVPRSLNLSQVINVLEESGIDVKTNGRTLTLTPKP